MALLTKRGTFATAVLVTAATLASPGPATASGPAAPGKNLIRVMCGSAGTLWVTVPDAEANDNAAAQIVGAAGHGIPVATTFTVTDATTGTTVFTNTVHTGNGHSHPNQATKECSYQPFPDTVASEFFPNPLPPGVAPTDIISGTATVAIVPKL